mgnify:CR=1 FL=1
MGYKVLRGPPRIKILEAAGSIADGRVKILRDEASRVEAIVGSSLGDRSYRVVLSIAGPKAVMASSDDNGTRFRGYIGYPIVAVMMLKGLLPRDPVVEEALRGVQWRVLNERFKSYERVLEEVFKSVESRLGRGVVERVKAYMGRVEAELSSYKVYLVEGL